MEYGNFDKRGYHGSDNSTEATPKGSSSVMRPKSFSEGYLAGLEAALRAVERAGTSAWGIPAMNALSELINDHKAGK